MKITTMRRVDRWLGAPACAALTGLRRLGDLRRRWTRRDQPPIERVLFVKLAEQGATVLAHPAIQRAVDLVGRQNVYFLVFEENRFILDVMGVVPPENVLTIPSKGLAPALTGMLRSIWRMRRAAPSAAVDLEFFARSSAILTYLSGAAVRVGLHGFDDGAPYRGDLMTHRLKYQPQLHTSRAYAAMTEAVTRPPEQYPHGAPEPPAADEPPPQYQPAPEELAEMDDVVARQAGVRNYRPLVLLNANASDLLPLRRWPPERYIELARRILQRWPQARIAFTGSPKEIQGAAALAAGVASDRCFSMAGKTTLSQLLTLYCLADVLVTNDSGPAHFATLTPIDVITMFGPETPAVFGSRAANARILWKDLPCSPCVNALNNRLSTCDDNVCMQRIDPRDVFQLVGQCLQERTAMAV